MVGGKSVEPEGGRGPIERIIPRLQSRPLRLRICSIECTGFFCTGLTQMQQIIFRGQGAQMGKCGDILNKRNPWALRIVVFWGFTQRGWDQGRIPEVQEVKLDKQG